jgi:hypothetical protein
MPKRGLDALGADRRGQLGIARERLEHLASHAQNIGLTGAGDAALPAL